jgi:hypothetical protein
LTSGKRFFRILVQKQKICFWSWEWSSFMSLKKQLHYVTDVSKFHN